MTKEKLIADNAELQQRANDWRDADVKIRKDFAMVLGQIETEYGYSRSTPKDLSWREIFCEVGKLIQFTNRERIEKRLFDIEQRLDSQPTVGIEASK